MSSPVKVLLTRVFPEIAVEILHREGFTTDIWTDDKPIPREILRQKLVDCDALLCSSSEKLDATFFASSNHLQVISQYAAGFDNIDLQAANRHSIPIGNTPDATSHSTADMAMALLLAVARNLIQMHKTIGNGEWRYFHPTKNLGFELRNKTLGIYGMGRIGFEMAKRCKGAFDMDILYHNRNRNAQRETLLDAQWVDFETLIRSSDIISVHCTLNDQTRGIFNREVFRKMKNSAVFINTSRGGVHNEEDLFDALSKGEIWGAGLDVTNPEPMASDSPLLDLPNVVVAPHIGSATLEARRDMAIKAAQNIVDFFKTGKVPYLINPGFQNSNT